MDTTNKQFWLMKTEPDTFSFDDLLNKPNQTDHWEGIRNYQARNNMKSMEIGDSIFIYHSVKKPVGIVGIAKVVKQAYPDFTSWDPNSEYFDAKSTKDNPRWFMVDVQGIKKLPRMIPLQELKEYPELKNMVLVEKGNRLSVQPVRKKEWDFIVSLK